jgi:hypothetical protein
MIGLAFREGLATGLLCLFAPGYSVFFLLSRWDERRGIFCLMVGPWLTMAISAGLFWGAVTAVQEIRHPADSRPDARDSRLADAAPPQPAPGPPVMTDPAPGIPGGFSPGPRFGFPPGIQPPPQADAVVTTPPAPAAPTPPAEPGLESPAGADAITRSMIEMKSRDKMRRKTAVERLQRSVPDGRVDQVVEALLPVLEDDDGFLVMEAVKALGVWRSPEAMQGVIGRLHDNRFFVRGEAIKALGRYRHPRAAEAIVPLLKEDGFAAEEALKSMGEVAEPALLPALRNPDSGVRRHACRILAEIGGRATFEEMQSLPPDPDFGVRVAANDAMKRIVDRVGPLPRSARGKAGTGR